MEEFRRYRNVGENVGKVGIDEGRLSGDGGHGSYRSLGIGVGGVEAERPLPERVERGESNADRWQLEQRIKHAENQLAVSGRS